ncbi:MAG: hypothetical protein ABIL58_05625 [Pseudomonadota bacterium]
MIEFDMRRHPKGGQKRLLDFVNARFGILDHLKEFVSGYRDAVNGTVFTIRIEKKVLEERFVPILDGPFMPLVALHHHLPPSSPRPLRSISDLVSAHVNAIELFLGAFWALVLPGPGNKPACLFHSPAAAVFLDLLVL